MKIQNFVIGIYILEIHIFGIKSYCFFSKRGGTVFTGIQTVTVSETKNKKKNN